MDNTHVTTTKETTVEKRTVVEEPTVVEKRTVVEETKPEPRHGETITIETHTDS